MRLIVAFLLCASGALSSRQASLAGKWRLHLSISGYEATLDCSFTQEGQEMTGSCTSDNGTVEVKGKVEGKNVRWTFTSESGGEKHDVVLKGVIESETEIRGSVEAPSYGVEGDFTAARKE